MAGLCRAVPLLVCPLLVVGCFDAHANDDAGPPARDAGPPSTTDAGRPPPVEDAGPPRLPDAGALACPPHRAFGACTTAEGLVAVRGVPFEMPFRMDECGCCPRTECAVADIDPDRRILAVVTTLCPDPCDCVACNPVEGVCAVPALPVAGEWEVRVNDAPAVILPVREAEGGPPNPAGCGTFAEDDGCGTSDVLTPDPWEPTDVCIRERFGREVVELRNDCWSCDPQGPCLTYFEPGPGGGTIHVGPNRYVSDCSDGICDTSCHELVRYCEIPVLPGGAGVYDIVVGGVTRATLGRGAMSDRTTRCGG